MLGGVRVLLFRRREVSRPILSELQQQAGGETAIYYDSRLTESLF